MYLDHLHLICLLSVFGFSVYFVLPSGGLLEHFFLEFHFDLSIVFLSILPCVIFLMDALDFSIYLTYQNLIVLTISPPLGI